MRLFIAINFSDETRSQLISLQEELRGKSKRGNFTSPENLHLTLVFLGDCNTTQTISIKSVMGAAHFEPIMLTIDSVGRFRRYNGDTWWAGVRENMDLTALHKCLSDKLRAEGFMLEKRKFKAHITLGREVVSNAKPWKPPPFDEMVNSIDLMKSERVNRVLTYTSIAKRSAAAKGSIKRHGEFSIHRLAKTNPADLEKQTAAIAVLAGEIWREHYTPIIGAEQVEYMLEKYQSARQIYTDIMEYGYTYFTARAEKNDDLIGYCGVVPKDGYLLLSKCYVQKDFRGKGIANAFFAEVAELCKAQHSYDKIRLTVNKDNSGSIAAYRKMGFETVDSVKTDIGGGFFMDDYIMECVI